MGGQTQGFPGKGKCRRQRQGRGVLCMQGRKQERAWRGSCGKARVRRPRAQDSTTNTPRRAGPPGTDRQQSQQTLWQFCGDLSHTCHLSLGLISSVLIGGRLVLSQTLQGDHWPLPLWLPQPLKSYKTFRDTSTDLVTGTEHICLPLGVIRLLYILKIGLP